MLPRSREQRFSMRIVSAETAEPVKSASSAILAKLVRFAMLAKNVIPVKTGFYARTVISAKTAMHVRNAIYVRTVLTAITAV